MTDAYEPTGFRPRCGYRLDRAPCPECGATFERAARVSPCSRRARLRRIALVAVLLLCAAAGLYFGVPAAVYRWWPQAHLASLAKGHGWAASTANEIVWWREKRTGAEALRRVGLIRDELAELDASASPARAYWVGDYSPGPGHESIQFLLAPHGGFVLWSHSDLGVYEFQFGLVREVGRGRLRLVRESWLYPGEEELAGEWQVVRWDDETWIVPVTCLWKFALESNSGDSFIGFARGAAERPYRYAGHIGKPDLPAEFGRYLLAAPVGCTLIAVEAPTSQPGRYGSGASWSMRGTVDAGVRDGLLPGLRLYSRKWTPYDIIVECIDEQSARVRLTWESWKGNEPTAPQAGLRLSTRNSRFVETTQDSQPATARGEQEADGAGKP